MLRFAVARTIIRKALKGGEPDDHDEQINRIIAKARNKVENPFRGLVKNGAHLFTLFALGKLFLMRRRLAV